MKKGVSLLLGFIVSLLIGSALYTFFESPVILPRSSDSTPPDEPKAESDSVTKDKDTTVTENSTSKSTATTSATTTVIDKSSTSSKEKLIR